MNAKYTCTVLHKDFEPRRQLEPKGLSQRVTEDALGLPASNYPPTLYDFYLTILYKQNFLATNVENLKLFNRPDHTGTREITPSLHEVTPMEIYWHIQKHSDELTPQLEAFATLKAIVEIVHSCPKGFTSYCAISNTVKAIGIGGSASLFVTVTGEAPYCEAKNDERKWCQKEDRSHGLVSTADTAHQGRRKKNNAAKLSRLF